MFSPREYIKEVLWPTRCIVCDEPGELLCEECRSKLPWIDQSLACANCGAPFGASGCTECNAAKGELWETRACISAMPLEGVAYALTVTHKDKNERRLAPVIAAIMATALDEAAGLAAFDGKPRFDPAEIDGVCFVPSTAKAFARRGFDHMEAVAKNVALFLSLPYVDALARPEGKDQRLLSRAERAKNADKSVLVVQDVRGCSLLLLDDVITTGASTRASARALLERGAKEVSACSLARTW